MRLHGYRYCSFNLISREDNFVVKDISLTTNCPIKITLTIRNLIHQQDYFTFISTVIIWNVVRDISLTIKWPLRRDVPYDISKFDAPKIRNLKCREGKMSDMTKWPLRNLKFYKLTNRRFNKVVIVVCRPLNSVLNFANPLPVAEYEKLCLCNPEHRSAAL